MQCLNLQYVYPDPGSQRSQHFSDLNTLQLKKNMRFLLLFTNICHLSTDLRLDLSLLLGDLRIDLTKFVWLRFDLGFDLTKFWGRRFDLRFDLIET